MFENMVMMMERGRGCYNGMKDWVSFVASVGLYQIGTEKVSMGSAILLVGVVIC